MKRNALDTTPYWFDTATLPRNTKLDRNLTVDVAVVGGGIAGVTAAYLLKKAGKRVALIERNRCARVDTGHTTAHLTCVTDKRLSELVNKIGRDHAQGVWDAGLAAIDQIRAIVRAEQIACELTNVPGFLHASLNSTEDERESLAKEAELARELGFDAAYLESTPLVKLPGVRFANQAKFHPLKYLSALVRALPGDGSYVFEHTSADEFSDEPLCVKAGGHEIHCSYLVIATHVPLMGNTGMTQATLFQTKLAPYTSYVIGGRLERGTAPEASFWDTSDPYYYLRVDRHRTHDYAIFGGEDCKTGQEAGTADHYRRLEVKLREILPTTAIDHHWCGQVIETHDGLPYIGEMTDRQFVATGFSGNGMTFGTLSGMMACDLALGRKNPWTELFSPHRKQHGGSWDYVKENADYPYYYMKDRLKSAEGKSLDSLSPGEGKILKLDGKRVAAYRNPDGQVTTVSPYCTHMGCLVHWNESETTWDCPCHGSRFQATGEVMAGPAESPLEKVEPGKKEAEQ